MEDGTYLLVHRPVYIEVVMGNWGDRELSQEAPKQFCELAVEQERDGSV